MTTLMRTEAVAAADAGQRFLDLGFAAALAQAAWPR
jgi:hypothetical protein